MKICTFNVDVTPSLGCGVGFGIWAKVEEVRDPLYLRGILLDDSVNRTLIVSMDYCGLMHRAYSELQNELALATETPVDQVVIHCIHQHDAPLLNFEIEEYLGVKTYPENWWIQLKKKCAKAAAESLETMEDLSEIGYSEYRLYGYASNRRVPDENGMIRGRMSRCDDPEIKNAPAGTIDPMLRTVVFKGKDSRCIASLSFYATHPQVANGRNMYSADAPGEAMRIISEKFDGLHCFFTGTGGNLAAGRYTSPTDLEGNLLNFGKKLADGIQHNLENPRLTRPETIEWAKTCFPFPVGAIDRNELLSDIKENSYETLKALRAAVLLSSMDEKSDKNYPICRLRLGDIRLCFLAGEPFIEHQLFIQSLIPDEFIAVAANCCNNFLYLPTKKAFSEKGGYELDYFCWCSEEFEEKFQQAIKKIL